MNYKFAKATQFILIILIAAVFTFLLKKALILNSFKFTIYGFLTHYFLPILILLILFYLIFSKKNNLKINFLLLVFSTAFGFYTIEIFLSTSSYISQKKWIAKTKAKNGFFDKRSNLKFVKSEREKGNKVYPITYSANNFNLLKIDGKDTLAFSGVANAESIFCNEEGKWLSLKTDELGFGNKSGKWRGSKVNLLLLGDSYGMSTCVEEKYRMHKLLDQELGNTVNLSYSMNGPLIQLAVLREYGKILKPKNIVWFYYGNDLYDLDRNIKNSILKSYLNKDFSQDLYINRKKVNIAMRDLSEKIYNDYLQGNINPIKLNFEKKPKIREILKLKKIRYILNNTFEEFKTKNNINFNRYEYIFKSALYESNKWGGKITFVYLPGYNELLNHKKFRVKNEYEVIRESLIPIISKSNVDIIDMLPILHSKGGVSKFYLNPSSHYNKYGYETITQEIIKKLK